MLSCSRLSHIHHSLFTVLPAYWFMSIVSTSQSEDLVSIPSSSRTNRLKKFVYTAFLLEIQNLKRYCEDQASKFAWANKCARYSLFLLKNKSSNWPAMRR